MRAVVLAAGDGGRLGHHTATVPKPLVSLAGRRIIDYTLDALAAAAVGEAIVVTGYLGDAVREGLERDWPGPMRLTFAPNPHFHDGASYSLAAARERCGEEPFLLAMADHLLSPELIQGLVDTARATEPVSLVAADYLSRDDAYTREATKLAIAASGRVTAIGKAVPGWAALDTGAFYCTPDVWDALDAVPPGCELSVVFGELARRGRLCAVDVSGAFWYDIDTVEDLAAASALLAGGAA
jgi:choline kinase